MVSGALPVIGHTPQFIRNRETLLKRGFREHGQIFSIRIPKPVAVVAGSQLNRWFYSETDRSLNMDKPYDFMRVAVGEALSTASNEVYEEQRPLLKVIFSNDQMRVYLQAMNAEVDGWIASLGDHGEVDISQAMRELTQHVAGHAFLGPRFRDEIGEMFWRAYADVGASLDPVFPVNWPLPKYKRRDRANALIRHILAPACEARLRDPAAHQDVLTYILTTPGLSGRLLDREQSVQFLMALLFAGHETTAGQAAWSIILSLQHEPVRRKLEQLVRALPSDAPLEAKSLRQLAYAYQIVDETTRLRPAADLQIRQTEKPVDVAGYRIPAGWRVMVTSAVSHHLEAQFPNSDRFDPERFSTEQGQGDDAYAIMGFGGGRHKCTGINFAKNEMAIILAKLFGRFDLELITPSPYVMTGYGANRPSPTLVRYQKRSSTRGHSQPL
jgi:sterol 14alpha-demethylase